MAHNSSTHKIPWHNSCSFFDPSPLQNTFYLYHTKYPKVTREMKAILYYTKFAGTEYFWNNEISTWLKKMKFMICSIIGLISKKFRLVENNHKMLIKRNISIKSKKAFKGIIILLFMVSIYLSIYLSVYIYIIYILYTYI